MHRTLDIDEFQTVRQSSNMESDLHNIQVLPMGLFV